MLQNHRKQNCWEHMQCGRGPGESRGSESCPAAKEDRLHGAHGGQYAGRSCWIVDGTMCDGKASGPFSEKLESCMACSFYSKVKEEEHPSFKLSFALLSLLKSEV